MRNLKRLLLVIIILVSQVRIAYSQTLSITETERDSIYYKVERGKINAERVRMLVPAIELCDSISNLKTHFIGLKEIEINIKDSIHENDIILMENLNLQVYNLESQVKGERKRGRMRAFWSFLKGTILGALIMSILAAI